MKTSLFDRRLIRLGMVVLLVVAYGGTIMTPASGSFLPNFAFAPDEPIHSLSLQITTGNGLFDGETDASEIFNQTLAELAKYGLLDAILPQVMLGGKNFPISVNDLQHLTADQVWFDVGSAAWRLTGTGPQQLDAGFRRGSTVTLNLDLSDLSNGGANTQPAIPLTVDDITYIRFVKQGIHGWVNAPDSFEALIFPNGASPAAMLSYFALHKGLQDTVEQQFSQLEAAISTQERVVKIAEKATVGLVERHAKLQQQLFDLGSAFEQARHDACDDTIGWLPFGGDICDAVQPDYLVYQKAIKPILEEMNRIEAKLLTLAVAQADLAELVVRKTAMLAKKAVADAVLPVLNTAVSKITDLIAALPFDALAPPAFGEWRPTEATLFVNGKVFQTVYINRTLKQWNSAFTSIVKWRQSDAEVMARSLRVSRNPRSGINGELMSGLTTPFKQMGISGWEQRPIQRATVVGVLVNPISPGLDNGVSLDLRVETLETGGQTFILDGRHGIRHDRFIRIEHEHAASSDPNQLDWHVGNRFRVTGPVLWDTDGYGFYEIHPVSSSDITKL